MAATGAVVAIAAGCTVVAGGAGSPSGTVATPAVASGAARTAVPTGTAVPGTAASGQSGTSVAPAVLARITEQANWILQAQLPGGALASEPIPSWSTTIRIFPYLSNYGAIGLARATSVTGDAAYATAAWRWLAWYASQELPGSGVVQDSTVANGAAGSVTSLGQEDSTDAYAGTFLLAAYDTEQADPSSADLSALAPGIAGAVRAIELTLQPDGMTWAKPSWQVAYLMDLAETCAGLRAAASLATDLGNSTLAARASADAASMTAAIGGLWRPATGSFAWAAFPSGYTQSANLVDLYPDTMEQLWPLAFGEATPAQSTTVLQAVAAHQPAWDQPDATATDDGSASPQQVGYWPLGAWAAEVSGNVSAGEQQAAQIWQTAQSHQGWPYTVADAGELIVAESGGPTLAPATATATSAS